MPASHAAPLVPDAAPVEEKPAPELSLNQKIALLSMARKGLPSQVYRELRLRTEVPTPFMSDYQALAGLGLATRPGKYHELTAQGIGKTHEVSKDLASKYGIHIFEIRPSTRYDDTLRCSCGYSRPIVHGMSKRSISFVQDKHLFGATAMRDLANAIAGARR